MPLKKLDRWLEAPAERRPVATSMATLDGYVAAIVAGPVSISPARRRRSPRTPACHHGFGNAVEAAYRRGDLFEKRRHLMNDWAQFSEGRRQLPGSHPIR